MQQREFQGRIALRLEYPCSEKQQVKQKDRKMCSLTRKRVPKPRMHHSDSLLQSGCRGKCFPRVSIKGTRKPLKLWSHRTRLCLKLEAEFCIIIHWSSAFAGIEDASATESWRLAAPRFQNPGTVWYGWIPWKETQRSHFMELGRWSLNDSRDQDVGNSRTVLIHRGKLASRKWNRPKIAVPCAVGDRTGAGAAYI